MSFNMKLNELSHVLNQDHFYFFANLIYKAIYITQELRNLSLPALQLFYMGQLVFSLIYRRYSP